VANRGDEPAAPFGTAWLFGLANLAFDLLPGAKIVQRRLAAIERQILRELRDRLDRIDTGRRAPSPDPAVETGAATETPAAMLADLLDRSTEQSPEEARRCAFVAILRQLVPDEARILAALSDGGGHPIIHVSGGSTLGASQRPVLSNVSSIGQAAGVQLREMTAHYVSHLHELGLVELAAEDPALAVKYEILESNTEVREAIAKVERRQRLMKARIVRRTLRSTVLGRELWAACRPEG
jgi:hypothetical protein